FDDTAGLESYYQFDHMMQTNDMRMENRTIERNYSLKENDVKDVISMYRKIVLNNGDEGVVVLNLNSNYLNDELRMLSQLDDQNVLIADDNGNILHEKINTVLTSSSIKEMLQHSNNVFTMNI